MGRPERVRGPGIDAGGRLINGAARAAAVADEMGIAMERGAPDGPPVVFDSPVGWLGVAVSTAGLRRVLLPNSVRRAGAAARVRLGAVGGGGCAARAVDQITQYLRGERREFELPLDLSPLGTDARTVLEELRASAPYGKVITYGELAGRSGCPGGARAVGQIMARNPLPLVIPCHRVVAAGDLGGYGGGLALKRRLLRLEGALTEQLSLLGDPSGP
jgi:methylated-DNA-[protein]-cysteine S-methyltransferase